MDVTEVPVQLTSRTADGEEVPVTLYVEARSSGGESEIGHDVIEGLAQVTGSIEAVSSSVARAVRAAAPHAFEIELGFELKAEAGGLVALMVRSGGTATIKVKLAWGSDGA